MLVSIHQPETLPWLSFFDKIDQADIFVLLDNVQFEKDYFQNRFKVRDGRGGHTLLTVPLRKSVSAALINERLVDQESKVLAKTLNCLKELYRKAPFFNPHFENLRSIMQTNSNLAELNTTLIQYLCEQFGIRTQLVTASELHLPPMRGGTVVNLELSRSLNASAYLSGKMGRQYLDKSPFEKAGIKVLYHCWECVPYPQTQDGEFIPHLSAVDLLFNCGPESLEHLRQGRRPSELS